MVKKIAGLIALLFSIFLGYQQNSDTTFSTSASASTTNEPIFKGLPKTKERLHLLKNSAFWVGYSESRGNPLWVGYKLTPPKKGVTYYERPDSFKIDKRTQMQVKSSDYTRTGYDRGHMAPNYAIMTLYGKKAQTQTFLMSNITPQKPSLNRDIWKELEQLALDDLTKLNREIFVYTGPIFSTRPRHLGGDTTIDIPTAFFKIFAMQKGNKVHMLGLIIPQTVRANEKLSKFVVSIDEIEKRTGLDFFSELNSNVEQMSERHIDKRVWRFNY